MLNIDVCRPGHTWALPGLFWIMRTHIMRTGRKDTWSPAYSIWVHRRTYSIQCSDKIHFPQLRIKCSVAKSCPGTHTALQAPMILNSKYVLLSEMHVTICEYGQCLLYLCTLCQHVKLNNRIRKLAWQAITWFMHPPHSPPYKAKKLH